MKRVILVLMLILTIPTAVVFLIWRIIKVPMMKGEAVDGLIFEIVSFFDGDL